MIDVKNEMRYILVTRLLEQHHHGPDKQPEGGMILPLLFFQSVWNGEGQAGDDQQGHAVAGEIKPLPGGPCRQHATLAVGQDFQRFKEETGLLTDSRVTESVAPSPFDYQQNCLLYLPKFPPRQKDTGYYDELAKEIATLLDAAQGHALALFTSYAAMSAVKDDHADASWK